MRDPISFEMNRWDPSSVIFTYGMCCNALLVVNSVGLLALLDKRSVKEDELYDNERYPDSIAIKGALKVLQYGNIVKKENASYSLTLLGKEINKQVDGYIHWFEAYSKLLAKSVDIANNRATAEIGEDFSLNEVAYSASLVKNRLVVPMLVEIISDLNPTGTICDMGCGTGETLIQLCETFQTGGIGFEKSPDIVSLANKNIKMNTTFPIHVYYADYLQMNGVYRDVDMVISNFITHHIVPDERCIEVLNSFKQLFPKSRYMIFMDTITPDDNNLNPQYFAPAFDYIHRLQRLETRGLGSLTNILKQTEFTLLKQIELDVPYSYIWLFKMN